MRGKRATTAGLIFAGIGLIIVVPAYLGRRPDAAPRRSDADDQATPQTDARGETTSTQSQPKRATAATKGSPAPADTAKSETATTEETEKADPRFDYGKLPSVKGNANPQVRSVAEALRDKDHPERLSPLIAPAKFDPVAFAKNRDAYASVIEPGRCFVTPQPGPGTPRLRPMSPQLQNVKQGASVKLRVQTAPNGCVSLTAFDGGVFKENGLNSITRLANEVGAVEATFVGTPGSINECKIVAGSPQASGTVTYLVNIEK